MKLIKFFVIFCLMQFSLMSFLGCGSEASKPQQSKTLDIYLLIGQSNMQGVAEIKALDTIALQNSYLFNNKNEWEKARNLFAGGINRYSSVTPRASKLGPGYTFAKKIADVTGKEIGLVSNARGATRIAWWQKGYVVENDYDLYEKAVLRVKKALEVSPGSTIKGIIWHQGEGDNSKANSQLYMDRLKSLVNDLRTDLNEPQLPIIVGEVGKWKGRGKRVNPVLRQIKENITNSEWVSSDGLTSIDLQNNNPHFDTFSQRVFGARYADKVLELIYKTSPGVLEIFTKKHFNGRSIKIPVGKYKQRDLERMGIGDGEIKSLTISPGYQALLYRRDFDDQVQEVNKDISYIKETFSSIKIIKEK